MTKVPASKEKAKEENLKMLSAESARRIFKDKYYRHKMIVLTLYSIGYF